MHNAVSMEAETSELSLAIGERMRTERVSQGLTLDQLSRRSGVSKRMLINVEQGSANPSVATLLRISDALGIGLPSLVAPPASRSYRIVRAGEAAELWSGPHGGWGKLLGGTEAPDVVELWEWLLEPGEAHISQAHTPGTVELLHLHKGSLVLTLDGQRVQLVEGDSIRFAGDRQHSYTNEGPIPVRFVMTVYEPGVGTDLHLSAVMKSAQAEEH